MDKMFSEHCDTEDQFDNKPYIFAFKIKHSIYKQENFMSF